jgi:hypothetical protein
VRWRPRGERRLGRVSRVILGGGGGGRAIESESGEGRVVRRVSGEGIRIVMKMKTFRYEGQGDIGTLNKEMSFPRGLRDALSI